LILTSFSIYVLGFRSPLAPLVKGGKEKLSSSPFLRGIEGDLLKINHKQIHLRVKNHGSKYW
jgi:hypothetical protein